jgi:hypothetical protein
MYKRRPTLGELSKVFAFEEIISLQENLPQTRRSGGVIPIIETIKSVKLLEAESAHGATTPAHISVNGPDERAYQGYQSIDHMLSDLAIRKPL